jgi:hypothetical protein
MQATWGRGSLQKLGANNGIVHIVPRLTDTSITIESRTVSQGGKKMNLKCSLLQSHAMKNGVGMGAVLKIGEETRTSYWLGLDDTTKRCPVARVSMFTCLNVTRTARYTYTGYFRVILVLDGGKTIHAKVVSDTWQNHRDLQLRYKLSITFSNTSLKKWERQMLAKVLGESIIREGSPIGKKVRRIMIGACSKETNQLNLL